MMREARPPKNPPKLRKQSARYPRICPAVKFSGKELSRSSDQKCMQSVPIMETPKEMRENTTSQVELGCSENRSRRVAIRRMEPVDRVTTCFRKSISFSCASKLRWSRCSCIEDSGLSSFCGGSVCSFISPLYHQISSTATALRVAQAAFSGYSVKFWSIQ